MTDIYFAKKDVHFTKTEKKLIDYIIASPQDFIRMSIGDVARCIGSSEPTVSRFAVTAATPISKNSEMQFWRISPRKILRQESSVPHWAASLPPPGRFPAPPAVLYRKDAGISRHGTARSCGGYDPFRRYSLDLLKRRVCFHGGTAPLPSEPVRQTRHAASPGSSELFEHMNFSPRRIW